MFDMLNIFVFERSNELRVTRGTKLSFEGELVTGLLSRLLTKIRGWGIFFFFFSFL